MQFDPFVVVIDWLDACRASDTEILMDLYDPEATLHCDCMGENLKGHGEIERYWSSRLPAQVPSAFDIDELGQEGDAVALTYTSCEGKPVQIRFWFNESGKIKHSLCAVRTCARATRV
jgi:ketosteroid isomerase-like protein